MIYNEDDYDSGGEIYAATWTAEDAGMDEDEWEEFKKRPRCAVLYPGN